MVSQSLMIMETGYTPSDANGMKSKLSILEGEDYDDRLHMDRRKK
jgi:hypothetical protein